MLQTWVKTLCFSLLSIWTGLFILPNALHAQDKHSLAPVELPPGVLPLPEAGSSSTSGTIISAENVTFYKEILIPELYRLIRFNQTSIDAARRVRYELSYDSRWDSGTNALVKTTKEFDKSGNLEFNFPRDRGFLFGDDSIIDEEWDILSTGQDSKDKAAQSEFLAKKILWNINSTFWSQGFIEFHLRLLWLKDGKVWRNARGSFDRIYPWILDPNFTLPQLFREKLSFYYPEALQGLSWLTFRFQRPEEDLVWAYSPAINKVRQLTSSNRSDSLITSGVSADDFLGWSGNPNFYRAKIEDKIVTLVPFPNADQPVLDDSLQPCYRLSNPNLSGSDQSLWNFENPKFRGGPDWLPIKAVFTPREVYKIELATKDPYSLYGREILYVDSGTMMPVYKIVFDRAGRHWKTIISSFGIASTRDRERRIPYNGFTVVLDAIADKSYVIDYSKLRYCDSYPQDVKLSQFDPKRLGP